MTSRGTTRLASLSALLVAGLVLSGCASTFAAAEDTTVDEVDTSDIHTLEIDGVNRNYIAHVPDGAAIGAPLTLPVLVVLHGAGSNAHKMETATGLSDLATADNFIVVYPSGTQAADIPDQRAWNAEGCCGLPVRAGVDDVEFITAVLDDVEEQYAVDTSRIFVAGFSNGGMMTYRLSCELGDRIAGIAVVAGAFNLTGCESDAATDALIVHGTGDLTVPYLGGPTNPRTAARFGQWTNASFATARATWIERDGCEETPETEVSAPVTIETFTDCDDDTKLEAVTIADGTHVWPLSPTGGFDASQAVVSFFGLGDE
ncbi:polyhydroxybutyrate depolymerase [Conyzicola lurida]|uniref:Polyhydroxybutyrate depolymerase n=1 Tax=Conyzicola lurida TaxID=1172621 RepID=A0A841ALK2_9MICO|nr:PHB depolymerase family esterase [Conyzicola lurida]MBB5842842.1 polyhydroxybutyrate depolymerase [Conyzicola lurida]